MNTKPRKVQAFYKPDGYKPEDSFGHLMRRIMALIAQRVEREFEPAGLTNAQWVPLIKLYAGKGSTVAELAREAQMDAGAMTRLLDRLEAKGLCQRQRNSEDRRVVNIGLTPAGTEAAQGIPKVLCDAQNALLAGFTQTELETLKGMLRRILENAEALQADGEKNDK